MNAKVLIAAVFLTMISACKKDEYTTRPQLTLKSVSTTTLLPNQTITFDITFTDAEGDIQDSIFVQKITSNCSASKFIVGYKIPAFPATSDLKGDFQVTFAYGLGLGYPSIGEPQCNKTDSSTFKFWATDLAKHVSDTTTTPVIAIVKR